MGLATFDVGRGDLAQILGCSTRLVTVLEGEGVIVPTVRGKGGRASLYDLRVAVPAYLAHVSKVPSGGSEREARRRRDDAQARFVEVKIAKEEGELLPREQFVQEGRSAMKGWSAQIRALPRRLRHEGIIQSREQEAAVASVIREVLTEISTWRTLADVERAVRHAASDAA